jgi:hypothetical protein
MNDDAKRLSRLQRTDQSPASGLAVVQRRDGAGARRVRRGDARER